MTNQPSARPALGFRQMLNKVPEITTIVVVASETPKLSVSVICVPTTLISTTAPDSLVGVAGLKEACDGACGTSDYQYRPDL